ncbi:sugar phosphate isomerase/epimerase family protein [Telluribacter humicola]|uniref:sugar phosphate isomerase/epimerase family protein n=1 Tax=Telluribacter humicola TaxID=1720261 RepID=UPI001A96D610|nr:sugar phosphate isomerase/epimerase [Telluribacter humicola]
MPTHRRQFLSTVTGLTGAALLAPQLLQAEEVKASPIACNQYTWFTFYSREGRNWTADLDASLAEFKKSGLTAYEPSFNNADEVKKLIPLVKKHSLTVPSAYVNSVLHKADEAQNSIDSVLAIAEATKPLGTRILVTNPSPISWGGTENKNDQELAEQAKNLDKLGAELRKRGVTLSYHTHDVELRAGAREFHHMLLATDPRNVTFCFDVHWVYRGSGNSQIAVFDVLKLYGKRITELHVRQSVGGVWSEAMGEGDIDYRRLAQELKVLGIRPHIVLEQCIEKPSPHTMQAVEAHQRSLAYARDVFSKLLG